MRDVDDAGAGGAEAPHDLQQTADLTLGQRGGRLVHDQDARVRADRLRDLDELPFGHAQASDLTIRIDRGADLFQNLRCVASARAPVDAAERAAAVERQRDVLGDGQARKQGGVLIDRRDAERARRRRIHAMDRAPRDGQRAGVGALGTRDDLDQGGLARAVLADERVHLAGREIERYAAQRVDAGERLGDVSGF